MADIKLPPIPPVAEWPLFPDALRARDIEVAKVVLEAAAKACEVQNPTGSINQEWMRERCANAIRALDVSHD